MGWAATRLEQARMVRSNAPSATSRSQGETETEAKKLEQTSISTSGILEVKEKLWGAGG